MPRPQKPRTVCGRPQAPYFKPRGIPLSELEEVCLPLDGFEALRLADLEGLDQATAARALGVSRATFGRILRAARTIVADALVHGRAIALEAPVTWNERNSP